MIANRCGSWASSLVGRGSRTSDALEQRWSRGSIYHAQRQTECRAGLRVSHFREGRVAAKAFYGFGKPGLVAYIIPGGNPRPEVIFPISD